MIVSECVLSQEVIIGMCKAEEMISIYLLSLLFIVCITGMVKLKCPKYIQWTLRAKSLCNLTHKYNCLYDGNSHMFTEFCRDIPNFEKPGFKFVKLGGRTGEMCNASRFQPFIFWTNVSSECVFDKSLCSGEGQVVEDNGTTTSDISCRCDYNKGYAFVAQPINKCSCVPSKSDCSCYQKSCLPGYMLNQDYQCTLRNYIDSQFQCSAIPWKPSVNRTTIVTRVDDIDVHVVDYKRRVAMVVVMFVLLHIGLACLGDAVWLGFVTKRRKSFTVCLGFVTKWRRGRKDPEEEIGDKINATELNKTEEKPDTKELHELVMIESYKNGNKGPEEEIGDKITATVLNKTEEKPETKELVMIESYKKDEKELIEEIEDKQMSTNFTPSKSERMSHILVKRDSFKSGKGTRDGKFSAEERNFLRTIHLLFHVCPKAIRRYFDRKFDPKNLPEILKNERPKIDTLQRKGVIVKHQLDLLFPAKGEASSEQFDLILMTLLLTRVFTDLHTDVHAEEAIVRIRTIRNSLMHSLEAILSNEDFEQYWKSISEAVVQLGGESFRQICDNLKHSNLYDG